MQFRNRKLRLEPLEDRRVLASVVVTNNLDTVDGDTSSLAALEAMPGDDGISIREAIEAANNTPGADEITFDFGHDGPEVILLTEGELLITDELTITGDGPDLLTIDAQRQSRIFNIEDPITDEEVFPVSVAGVTLTQGYVDGDGVGSTDSRFSGGAIRSETLGELQLSHVAITDCTLLGHNSRGGGISVRGDLLFSNGQLSRNRTAGGAGYGGALYAELGNVQLINSIVANNEASGSKASGGAVYLLEGDLFVAGSTISNNHVRETGGGLYNRSGSIVVHSTLFEGNSAGGFGSPIGAGGAIYTAVGDVRIDESSIVNNWTNRGGGGAIATIADLQISNSLITLNHSVDNNGHGGAIAAFANISISNSTISNNWTEGVFASGGAISSDGPLQVFSSTFVGNGALGRGSNGGGIYTKQVPVSITGTIISGNQAEGLGDDIYLQSGTSSLPLIYSLIGNTADSGIHGIDGVGNLLNVDPHLGPLADHGGPTMTHALLPGSPAIDAGDPSIAFDPMEYDQRGEGFARVADGGNGLRIDIGAYESQGVPDYPVGDYNHDGIAGIADYVLWRNTLGSTANLAADGSGNDVVDAADYTVWREHFGNTTIPLTPVEPPAAAVADAAFAALISPASETDNAAATLTPSSASAERSADEGLLLLGRGNEAEPNNRRLARTKPVAHAPSDVVVPKGLDVAWGLE